MKAVILRVACVWLLMNVIAALAGILMQNSTDAKWSRGPDGKIAVDFVQEGGDCRTPKIRIGYAFPGFRFGCWLGEEVGK